MGLVYPPTLRPSPPWSESQDKPLFVTVTEKKREREKNTQGRIPINH